MNKYDPITYDDYDEPGGLMAINPDWLIPLIQKSDDGTWLYWCEACQCSHGVTEDKWTIDSDVFSPSVSPSVKITDGDKICHHEITRGWIVYLDGSTHNLKGVHPLKPL